VSALTAGNSVILKPSEITENTSSLIKQMCTDIFDESLVAVCEGNAEVAKALLRLPFDHIFFTGSPNVGKVVMRAAAEHLASVTLELGGKSPAIISPSASLSLSARRIAVAKFINTGQTCIAPDYVLVHASVAEKFVNILKSQVQSLFSEEDGPISQSPHYARVVSSRHFDRLANLLQDAIDKGANLPLGGEVNKDQRFIHPTILTDVSNDSLVMQEEIFGPILPILTYTKLDEVILRVNKMPKPLAVYYFGSSKSEIKRVKSETSSGGLCINDCAIHFLHHNLPFGGVNNSGIGKSHGYYGFLAFSNEKAFLRQNRWLTSVQFLYPPYTKRVKITMGWLLRLFSR
jgi:aldehyde dehydrogenase (NAD+)